MLLRLYITITTAIIFLLAVAPATASEPVRLLPKTSEQNLHSDLKVLPDVDARWTVDDFPNFGSESSELTQDGQNFSSIPLKISRYWLTFDVINQTDHDKWVIFIPMHLVNSVELIAVDPHGTRQSALSGEDLEPYKRPFNDFGNSLPLTLEPNQRYQVAILVHDYNLPTLSINELSLINIERYSQVSFRLSTMIIASLATMIVMGLFMLLIWWRIKDPTYGWYALFSLATFVIWSINYELFRTLFLSTQTLYLANYLAMAAMLFFSAQLTRSYLELRRFSPRIDRIYHWYGILTVLWMCVVGFTPFTLSYRTSAGLALLALPILFSALFVTLRAGFRPARLYLVAWTLYFSNGALAALDGLGMNFSTASVRLLTVTSTAIGLIVMAYSVVQRIEQLRSEKTVAEEQARTDALTNLYNRAAFEFDCSMSRISFKAGELNNVTFIFIDLDGLKKINDTQGHHTGDKLLIAFADNLNSHFRNHDSIYRLGGDEFVIVFKNEDNETLSGFIHERLAAIIDQLKSSEFPAADCSFGIASITETDGSFKNAIKLADKRMYQHKTSKRTPAPATVH